VEVAKVDPVTAGHLDAVGSCLSIRTDAEGWLIAHLTTDCPSDTA